MNITTLVLIRVNITVVCAKVSLIRLSTILLTDDCTKVTLFVSFYKTRVETVHAFTVHAAEIILDGML